MGTIFLLKEVGLSPLQASSTSVTYLILIIPGICQYRMTVVIVVVARILCLNELLMISAVLSL